VLKTAKNNFGAVAQNGEKNREFAPYIFWYHENQELYWILLLDLLFSPNGKNFHKPHTGVKTWDPQL
jgi:hypothetical protein